MIERRKYKRASLIGLVEVRETANDPPLEAYAMNISCGGLAIYVKKPLAGKVYVTLYFGDGTGQRLGETVVSQVVWKKEMNSWYAAGLEFEKLNSEDHSMILDFLKRSEPATQANEMNMPTTHNPQL